MDLQDYLRTLAKRWKLVALCTLLALAAATVATLATSKTYQASTQLFVSTPTQTDVSQLAQGGTFTQQRVKSYADIVTSPAVLQPVIDGLGLTLTPTQLGSQISTSVPLETVLINVNVKDSSPTQAAKIANAVAQQFTTVVSDLETPDGASRSPVKVSVVRQAQTPTAPVSPRKKVNLALGLLIGLALGVGAAVLRETLDTSVKSLDDLTEHAESPVLGVIGFDQDAIKRPVIMHADPHSPRAEAFRQLRTNLQFVDVDSPPRSIVITSSLPGEGKTTSAINLAVSLAEAGKRVVLVEADLRRPRIASYLGLVAGAGLTTLLVRGAELGDLLQQVGGTRLSVLVGGPNPPNPSELLGSKQMVELLKHLESVFDYVIIDAPPLLPVTDAAVLSRSADAVILVVRARKTRREQVARAVDALQSVDARLIGSVLNMAPTRGPDAYTYGYYDDYKSRPSPPSMVPPPSGPMAPTVLPTPTPKATETGARRRRS